MRRVLHIDSVTAPSPSAFRTARVASSISCCDRAAARHIALNTPGSGPVHVHGSCHVAGRGSPVVAPLHPSLIDLDASSRDSSPSSPLLILTRRCVIARVLVAAEQSDQPERAQLRGSASVCAVARARLSSTFGRAKLVLAPWESRSSLEYLGGLVPRGRAVPCLDAGTAPNPGAYRAGLAHESVPSCDRAATRHLARIA